MTTWLGLIRHRDEMTQIERVTGGGFCVGCGICAVAAPQAVTMQTVRGAQTAVVHDPATKNHVMDKVCPFSNSAPNEDDHSSRLYSGAETSAYFGPHISRYAGFVTSEEARMASSSGGMTTWILEQLLMEDLVDAIVHVSPSTDSETLFSYSVSRTPGAVRAGARTRYYSVSLAEALREALDSGDRLAVVGVPCFIKAVRNLQLLDPVAAKNIRYAASLVCGHMKTHEFAESLAWQVGVPPGEIQDVDFRVKLEGRPSSAYGFAATKSNSSKASVAPMQALEGRRWDAGYFKLKACEYCDDVVGETADVSLGDAWLPEYRDWRGANLVIVRDHTINGLLKAGIRSGELELRELSHDEAFESQAGGFRDRRQDLAYRLHRADRAGMWRPRKRVDTSATHLNTLRKITIISRQSARRFSYLTYAVAKRTGVLAFYTIPMKGVHAWFRLLETAKRPLRRR